MAWFREVEVRRQKANYALTFNSDPQQNKLKVVSLERCVSVVSQVLQGLCTTFLSKFVYSTNCACPGKSKTTSCFHRKNASPLPRTWRWMLLHSPMLKQPNSFADCYQGKVKMLGCEHQQNVFFSFPWRWQFHTRVLCRVNLWWTLVQLKPNGWKSDKLTPPLAVSHRPVPGPVGSSLPLWSTAEHRTQWHLLDSLIYNWFIITA